MLTLDLAVGELLVEVSMLSSEMLLLSSTRHSSLLSVLSSLFSSSFECLVEFLPLVGLSSGTSWCESLLSLIVGSCDDSLSLPASPRGW